jgi:hypothetical protein
MSPRPWPWARPTILSCLQKSGSWDLARMLSRHAAGIERLRASGHRKRHGGWKFWPIVSFGSPPPYPSRKSYPRSTVSDSVIKSESEGFRRTQARFWLSQLHQFSFLSKDRRTSFQYPGGLVQFCSCY